MPTKRIEALVDGIFAIAMTILVLELTVPAISGQLSNTVVQEVLLNDILPRFYSVVLSFALLGVFWVIHHRIFQLIKRVDNNLLFINITWLLFIVLVPFTTTLIGDYGFPISHAIFNLNMFGIALFLYLNWHYADRSALIHEKVDAAQVAITKRINLLFILLSLLAILLSFIIPHWCEVIYALIIPLEAILKRL